MGNNSKRNSMMAAFTAGALTIASLMFASDRMNLFTGSSPAVVSATSASPGTSNGSAKTASLNSSGSADISTIAKQASPAVVKIETKVKAAGNQAVDPFFRQFFGGNGIQESPGQDNGPQEGGLGTGFIFESSGYILTNEHVIDGAQEIDVTVQGYDTPFKAKLLGSAYDLDLAVLKIEGKQAFPTPPIGNSDNAQVGEWVVAIGNPYDLDYTVTAGVISAKDRPISIPDEKGTRGYKHLLQTDTAINPGNSGGPSAEYERGSDRNQYGGQHGCEGNRLCDPLQHHQLRSAAAQK
ncbi:trypsin-like peptidase domain-containing protein [Paenibacillus sp. P26]|nr:trypsin-like peptidase domain-containing protein [Paenibacillus sp. P26]